MAATNHVITIAQQKGGAGKTTLAVHLATAWSLQGKSVALVDIDPQGSLSRWYNLRRENYGNTALHPEVKTITGWRVNNEVARLSETHDIVVVDSPPHTQTEAKIAIRAASTVVIPLQPSPMDLWATEPTLKLCRDERVPALIVLNRVPPRTLLTDEIRNQLLALNASVANCQLGNRIQFAASLLKGRGIAEVAGKSPAAEEIFALAGEILKFSARDAKAAA
ncbi:MAG: ParA family protein [Alphaproteobacteria bacterium]|jgi:chromosome partitioning protein|nr:ParA family protein [Thalassospira sp.]MCE2965430.1 ParA family protein [Alphaproteobacteria bacterium]